MVEGRIIWEVGEGEERGLWEEGTVVHFILHNAYNHVTRMSLNHPEIHRQKEKTPNTNRQDIYQFSLSLPPPKINGVFLQVGYGF
jgi:hypothetical protein